MYWDMVYRYLADLLAEDAGVREASLVVRFESLCEAPRETLLSVLGHCALADAETVVGRYAPGISAPSYYKSNLSAEDLAVIRAETAATACRWGYSFMIEERR
jgi:hypothetical protein